MSTWDFYFEKSGLVPTDGATIPSAEFFTTKDFEDHLVREMIQNSLDARADDDALVRVEFETMALATEDLPGIETLRDAASRAAEQAEGSEGYQALLDAAELTQQSTVPVLRIGDYGTKGLTGSESKAHPKSALSTLTRGVGISSNDGGRGGSFGIGSAVALVGSTMRTVAYVSLPQNRPEQVFAMTARLSWFQDEDNVQRAATGFYIRTDKKDDFHYMRSTQRHEPFHARTEPGTDTYILGYRQENIESLEAIRRAVIRNFFVAILTGGLEVSVMGEGAPLVIDADAVREVLGGDDDFSTEMAPFVRAYDTDEEHVVRGQLKHTGSCELRIYFDESMKPKPAAMLMRRPKMLITHYKPQLPFRYAAVFICHDEKGNKLLRGTEPAQHDKWSTDGVRGHGAAVNEIREFIRNTLREKAPATLESSTTVAGLARLLPKPADTSPEAAGGSTGHGAANPPGAPDGSPGGARRSQAHDPEALEVVTSKPVSIRVTSSATAGSGDEPGTSGGGSKPSSKRKQKKTGGKPTKVGGTGGGSQRLEEVRMKSFISAGAEATTLVLTSGSDQRGNLALRAQGLDGRLTAPPIAAAVQLDESGTARPLEVLDGTIKDVSVFADSPTRLQVTFNGAGNYRLTVKEG